ncbi:unnamed protein product [marine sediment metagenome]|uniref:Uncharacterized protein n=1 Tax=marine sediment metagenome TaxID=412755 RepID=X1BC49_9ZZZZ
MFRIEVKDVSIYKTFKFYYEAIESGKIDLSLIAERLLRNLKLKGKTFRMKLPIMRE